MKTRLLIKIVLSALMFVPVVSHSITQTTQVKQSVSVVPLGASVMVSLDWTVRGTITNQETVPPLVAPVASSEGRFCTTPACTNVLDVVGNPLTTNSIVSITANLSETLPMRELIRIPTTVVRRAQQLGATSVSYVRSFTDGSPLTSIGAATFAITSGATGSFEVTRIALSFSDGAPLKILAKDQSLSVQAKISVTGVGLIQGLWEVANPVGLADKPIFSPLARVQKQVSVTETVKLDGPELPTSTPGLHVVRLRIDSPNLTFESPIIRYFVTGQDVVGSVQIKVIETNSPLKNASLNDATKFSWEGVANAVAYQLELYEAFKSAFAENLPDLNEHGSQSEARLRPGQKPVTGILLPTKSLETTLTKLNQQNIRSGGRYYWRVIAIDKDGRVIGESQLRSIYAP